MRQLNFTQFENCVKSLRSSGKSRPRLSLAECNAPVITCAQDLAGNPCTASDLGNAMQAEMHSSQSASGTQAMP